MSQTATTSASLCWRKASSTWSPRLPRPMKPRRTRSLAPSTREAARAVPSPARVDVVKSRRVSLLMTDLRKVVASGGSIRKGSPQRSAVAVLLFLALGHAEVELPPLQVHAHHLHRHPVPQAVTAAAA